MIRRLVRRLGSALLVLWSVASLTFVIADLLPSDPARMIAGPTARAADVARIRAQIGTDRPLAVRYGLYLRHLVHLSRPAAAMAVANKAEHADCASFGPLHLDLGHSYTQRKPVVAVLADRAPRSLLLAVGAVTVQLIVGLLAGLLAAFRPRSWLDRTTIAATVVGTSVPTYLIGITLQYVLGHRLHLLPLDGFGRTDGEHLVSLVLPALTLGIFGAAYYARLVRDDLLAVMRQDFVRTARAKGASRLRTLLYHALRTTLVPVLTVVGLELGALVGGAVVVETLFRWPGIGALAVSSLLDHDGPLILGITLTTSACIVLSNLVVDAMYVLLDPRIRRAG
jgi:peptide/nickel transport system permease protein